MLGQGGFGAEDEIEYGDAQGAEVPPFHINVADLFPESAVPAGGGGSLESDVAIASHTEAGLVSPPQRQSARGRPDQHEAVLDVIEPRTRQRPKGVVVAASRREAAARPAGAPPGMKPLSDYSTVSAMKEAIFTMRAPDIAQRAYPHESEACHIEVVAELFRKLAEKKVHESPVAADKYITDMLRTIDYVGIYSNADRATRVARFMEKRALRTWAKRVKYDSRQKIANARERVHGRFVKLVPKNPKVRDIHDGRA